LDRIETTKQNEHRPTAAAGSNRANKLRGSSAADMFYNTKEKERKKIYKKKESD
jgi:hypothetical protein